MPSKKTWFFNSPQLHRIATAAVARIPTERGERDGGQNDALVAIVFAALAIEGFANEFGELVADEFYWDPRVTPDLAGLATAYRVVERERGSLELKLQVLRIALQRSPWPPGEGAFQELVLLRRLRDALVHLKLDVRAGDTDSADPGPPPALIKQLRSTNIFAENHDAKAATWTVAVSTRAAARWACNVVARMVEETIGLVPPSEFRDDVTRHFGSAFVRVTEGASGPTRASDEASSTSEPRNPTPVLGRRRSRMRRVVAVIVVGLVAVCSCAAGVGLGIVWHSRSRVDHWDADAMRATFRSAYLEGDGEKKSPVFFYQVENKTTRDYSIEAVSDVQLFVKDAGALDSTWGEGIAIDVPVFIPSGDRAGMAVHFRVMEGGPSSASKEDEQVFLRDRARSWNEYESIVLLDSRYRYRIEFPIGTRDGTP